MYAHVKLLNGFSQLLTYTIPAEVECSVGTLVKVPLRHRFVSGMIVKITDTHAATSYAIKPIAKREEFPIDAHYSAFIEHLAAYYALEPVILIKRLNHFLQEKTSKSPALSSTDSDCQIHMLTNDQQIVVNALSSAVDKQAYTPAVLHGVTGSGKTEVYKHLIMHAYAAGKSSLLMLPEVTLAVRFFHVMRTALPAHIPIFSFHSASPAAEKKQLWQALLAQKPCLIIGVHLPILLPIANLGIIMVDEEHEVGYQEKKHPKINSKEAALLRAAHAKIPILLGSATPSIATLYNVEHKGWPLFTLKERFSGAFPRIRFVSLTKDKARHSFWITKELQKAIADRLAKKEQTIIFLNRRGYSFFVQCKDCSFIFTCTTCSVSLTLHAQNVLQCHYCGHQESLPTECNQCHHRDSFLKKGIGTQQVVDILQKLFPAARIARADLDTTSQKKVWQDTVHAIEKGALDIIVGTQTITKGYHFPKVTLVGILWADLNLHFPLYNAAETTLQQIIQVAGRAGRACMESEVIIQAMIEHAIFNTVTEKQYRDFYDQEIKHRMMVEYPPITRLVELELKHTHEGILDQESMALAQLLLTQAPPSVTVLGPAKPLVSKIKNMHSRKIYLKSQCIKTLIGLFLETKKQRWKSKIYFTPNPLS